MPMLHQTLTPPLPFAFHPSSSPLLRSSPARMETALKGSCRPDTAAQPQMGFLADDVAWPLEKGNIFGEEFSIDDLLDFGEEDVAGGEEPEAEAEEEEQNGCLDGENSNSSSTLSFEPAPPSEIALPVVDVAELEWVSRIMDDSYSEFPPTSGGLPDVPAPKPVENPEPDSPNGAVGGLSTEALVPVKAKRSKRARTAGWVRPNSEPASSSSASSPTSSCSSTSSSSSSCLIYDFIPGTKPPSLLLPADDGTQPSRPKKRGRKPKAAGAGAWAGSAAAGERRCSHCGVQKTPQWRAGPMGAKTLCNACGVRFKSGRLLPEYRPACSPTFISHVHSNSHRKVLEMRRKKAEEEERRSRVLSSPSPAPVTTT